MTGTRTVHLIGCLVAGVATPATAQLAGTLDVGAGSNHPDRSIPGAVASFAPALTFGAGPLRLSGAGVYSDAAAGRWNFQGTSGATVRSPNAGIFRAELLGQADWTWHHRVQGVTTVTGELRAYASPSPRSLLWVGRGIGSGWSLGRRRPLERTVMGASAGWGRLRLGLSVTNTTFDLMNSGALEGSTGDSTVLSVPGARGTERRAAFTDATLASEWEVAGLRLDLSLGRRFSRTVPEVMLWGVSATRNLLPGVAFLASTGRAGSDPVTALPGSRYFVLGLRLSTGAGLGFAGRARPAGVVSNDFHIGPARITGREVVLRAPHAHIVELAGDFTDWRPVELDPAPGGAWRMVVPITPGLHRVAVRMDGGRWQAPPGARAVTSEFGGQVGEVMVE
ncbi:MAG: glycogen-binding domain-containing protein [Gemmatimonadales bacterium]